MRAIHMRKLILIPTIVITGFLALAFVQPAGAAGLIRAVAPGLHVALPAAVSAAGGSVLRVVAEFGEDADSPLAALPTVHSAGRSVIGSMIRKVVP